VRDSESFVVERREGLGKCFFGGYKIPLLKLKAFHRRLNVSERQIVDGTYVRASDHVDENQDQVF
jgi:hypothetical protein